jgi:farnesyl diphosphate synthase
MSLSKDQLAQELERCAGLVERRLDEILGAGDGGAPGRLAEAMRYAVLGGGKRIRPFLLLTSANLFGVDENRALQAAAAIECVHCYSLAHDDLPSMDDDALRRGRPSLHIAFGEATAILAGDALLTLAFRLLSDSATHPDPMIRDALVRGLAEAAGWRGMVHGQQLDLDAEGQPVDLDAVAHIQRLKTGALIRFACEAGGILGGAGQDDLARLGAFGACLGLAYQLTDDLLDAEGDTATIGKAAAKDAERGKATFVGLLGTEGTRARLDELVLESEASLADFGPAAAALTALARLVATRDR